MVLINICWLTDTPKGTSFLHREYRFFKLKTVNETRNREQWRHLFSLLSILRLAALQQNSLACIIYAYHSCSWYCSNNEYHFFWTNILLIDEHNKNNSHSFLGHFPTANEQYLCDSYCLFSFVYENIVFAEGALCLIKRSIRLLIEELLSSNKHWMTHP